MAEPQYSPDLNAGLLHLESFAEEVRAMLHTNLAAVGVHHQGEDELSVPYIRKTCRSFCRYLEAVIGNNGGYIKLTGRQQSNICTQVNHFQGLP